MPSAVPDFNSNVYSTLLQQYCISVDLYKDLLTLLDDILRVISLHPEHNFLYKTVRSASSFIELAYLLGLICKEWHGIQLQVFEVGTGRRVSHVVQYPFQKIGGKVMCVVIYSTSGLGLCRTILPYQELNMTLTMISEPKKHAT